jgi:hypothetical protein
MLAVRFYDIVVSLHVMAIVVAFGVTFAYPVLIPYVVRNHPRAVPALYAAMVQLNRRLITPAATVALLLGVYLATDAEVWDQVWVTVPLVILVIVLGMVGAVFTPVERQIAELTARDVAGADAEGSPGGPAPARGTVAFSAEAANLMRRDATAGAVASVLILVAIYFMVAKPFAG